MSDTRKIALLLLAMLAILILPWLGSYIYNHGHFPAHFFDYPPLDPQPIASFNLPVFVFISIGFVGTAALYLFPQLYGFRREPLPPQPHVKRVGLPIWFWLGLIQWSIALFLLVTRAVRPVWLLHWSDLPLFWGFTLMLDGWVYVRTGGKSMISRTPQELVGIGVSSVTGWMLFEYLNFFVKDNWYYPFGCIISPEQFLLYAFVISSGLLPLSFEWYCVFKTFPALKNKYSYGRKIILPEWVKNGLLVLSLLCLFGAGLYPDQLFFSLWVAPALLLALVLDKLGVWTPLRPIGQGNWSPAMLSALSYLVEGLCLEGQNYISGMHYRASDGTTEVLWTMAPAYWQYHLPYVNVLHLFEMPLLGFLGYLPFGVYCWLWWIAFATLLSVPSRFYKEEPFLE